MEEPLHSPDDLDEPLPPEPQALLDSFKAYAVWHPRLVQVQTHLLHTIWEPADVAYVVRALALREFVNRVSEHHARAHDRASVAARPPAA